MQIYHKYVCIYVIITPQTDSKCQVDNASTSRGSNRETVCLQNKQMITQHSEKDMLLM